MAAILEPLVDVFNRIGYTTGSIFNSLVTINYHLGSAIIYVISFVSSLVVSFIVNLVTCINIIFEDLWVFILETVDMVLAGAGVMSAVLDSTCNNIAALITSTYNGVTNTVFAVVNAGLNVVATAKYCAQSLALFSSLLGSSIMLLIELLPRTLYLLWTMMRSMVVTSYVATKQACFQALHELQTAPPELYLGLVVGAVSFALITKYTFRFIRERQITSEDVATFIVSKFCSTYLLLVRSISRAVRFIYTLVQMTVGYMRVPMFAHAGDSEDEEEDRENLVGELEESDDEDRQREAEKKRNYKLLLERRSRRDNGERRGSTDSNMEELLLREVEREREDKLCVICVDKEKCIMILPCRHLCICEECQEPLRTHRNLCPICRKQVKQMIKAYL